MQTSTMIKRLIAVAFAIWLTAFSAHAQVVSAGLTGVVKDSSGKAVGGAKVSAVHVPTGTSYTAVTRGDGRFNFRSMVVGGPYTVKVDATGFRAAEISGVNTELGNDVDLPVSLEAQTSSIVTMEKYTVSASADGLDGSAAGAGSLLTSDRLEAKPTAQRSLADLISASPMVTLRATIGDREESQLSAVGQNNRYNSILIDGARINDQFGLNMTGLASFFNPLSIDTIEQLSVQVSPYDVRQAGFTGASINAVTKSGTNQFKGSAYHIWGGDEIFGFQMQGEDVGTLIGTGVKTVPKLKRTTQGFTFGGPIWKNRIFFFLNFEKFERVAAPGAPGLLAVNSADMTSFLGRLAQYNTASGKTINWGDNIVGSAVTNVTTDEKKLAKIDWNISQNHRASVRYSITEGELPQFGKFQNTNVINNAGLTSSGATALSTHIYTQERKEDVLAAQIFSQWTPDFRTELKASRINQDQDTPLAVVAPEIAVFGLGGVDRSGRTITDAAYVAGTEFSRHGNAIFVDSKNFSATADYNWRNFVFSGGLEREESKYFNLFRQGSYGSIVFRNMADFLNDIPARIDRNAFDPTKRGTSADISDFATNGIFAQAKWDYSRRLWVQAGLRYEVAESDLVPPFNQAFLTATGFNNTATIDGAKALSPRVAFNLMLNDERTAQLRGGVGHFLGRAPWVLFSNSYNSPGVGDFTITDAAPAQGAFTTYLRNFDPANPIGTVSDTGTNRRSVNWVDQGIELPSVWRGNLALDYTVKQLGGTLTFEVVHTINDNTFFITNENLRPITSPAADGRQRFAGNPQTLANAKFAGYNDLYRIRNVTVGESTYVSLGFDRPMRNNWSYNFTYTHGAATDAQSFGQTTASGQWQRNVVFNQSTIEERRSDFEIRHRLQMTLAKEFEFVKKWKTLVSLYYEVRSGDPFSWVYTNDLNGDGQSGNDIIAVPSGLSDPRFDFSGLTSAQADAYVAFMSDRGLGRFAGGVAEKNASRTPWVNRLDLHLSQRIPIYKPVEVELFADFINFGAFLSEDIFGGYFVEANQKHFGSEMFRRNRIGAASYAADGRIRPTTFAPDNFITENGQSRWKVQLGARVRF
jgi:hypothetical protein